MTEPLHEHFTRPDGLTVDLYCGDCLDVLPTLGKVDAVVTDPPYGLNFPYYSYKDTLDNLSRLIEFVPISQAMSERIIVLCGPTQITQYPRPDWVGAIVWNTTGTFGKYGYSQWTPVLLYGDDLDGFGNINGVTKTDVLRINGGAGVGFMRDDAEKEHTCPKPITMMVPVVNRYTKNNSTVLDPFMGSGTTGVAAVRLGRSFIGIEIEPKYYAIARRRILEALAQPALFQL